MRGCIGLIIKLAQERCSGLCTNWLVGLRFKKKKKKKKGGKRGTEGLNRYNVDTN